MINGNGFIINTHKSVREIQEAHPEIKNLRALMSVPKGMELGGICMYLHKRGVSGQIFRVGNVIWKEAETTEKIP
jgi:hypothetical protein